MEKERGHRAGADPQESVAHARANVLAGRGPGAPKEETDRYKRERPTLGALPAPLERELVHLDAMRIRSGRQQHVGPVSIRNQNDRLREVWAAKPATHPRIPAVRDAVGGDAAPARGPGAQGRRWAWRALAAAAVADALWRRRRRQADDRS